MKVLQINCVYKQGSTGKIVYDIHNYLLANRVDSTVLYGRGNIVDDEKVFKVSSEWEAKIHSLLTRISGVEFGYSPMATRRTIRIIKEQKPDVVHLHCLNGHFINAYKLIDFLKKNDIKTILTLHAEIMHTAGCEHAKQCDKWRTQCSNCDVVSGKITHYFRDDAKHCFNIMKKAVTNFDRLTVVGVSAWLTNRAMQSAVFLESNCAFTTVRNGLNSKVFYPRVKSRIREELNLQGEVVILHVTPNFYHPIKGGKYVIEVAKRNPEWKFVIVGYNGDNAMLPNNTIGIEHTNNQDELAEYYSMADITLLTSQRETFSMVCAESLCCGTPVIGFLAGGPESISIGEYSTFVEQGNVEELEKAISQMLDRHVDVDTELCRKTYNSEEMAKCYMDIYNR